MNKIDRQWYKHLKFLSKWTLADAYNKLKKENPKLFNKYFEGEIWNELHKIGYVSSHIDTHQIVTEKGLKELRMLEDIRRKDLTLIISVIAIIISIVAFAKSMGWI